MVEHIIQDCGAAYSMPSVIFRYFNAAGADSACDLGEDHTPETHLIPLVFDAIVGKINKLQVFGDDYPTEDGTCIRDYIHVSDLAIAHVLGLQYLFKQGGHHVFNLGNGTGYSVQQVIAEAERVTGHIVPRAVSARRPGDPPVLVASSKKARECLGWNPIYSDLKTILQHAWSWHQSGRKSFNDVHNMITCTHS